MRIVLAAGLGLALLGWQASAATFMIDDFESPQSVSGTGNQSDEAPADVLGGFQAVTGFPGSSGASFDLTIADGSLSAALRAQAAPS